MYLKRIIVVFVLAILSLSQAQETCSSLIDGLKNTFGETRSLTRTMQIKLGFLQLMSNTSLVENTTNGLQTTTLEHSGRQIDHNNAPDGFMPPEESWLGIILLDYLTCKNHHLENMNNSSYKLTLNPPSEDENSAIKVLALNFIISSDTTYLLESLQADLQPPNLPFIATVNTSFFDWSFSH